MSHRELLLAILVMAVITFGTRLLPFIVLRGRKLPPVLAAAADMLPLLTLILLIAYCLKDVRWASAPHGLPEISGIAVAAFLQFWKKNMLLSIAVSTGTYLILAAISW